MNKKRIFGAVVAIILAVTLIFGTQVNSASASEVPIGTIMAYAGDKKNAKSLKDQGWVVCDGQELTLNEYKTLYETIGTYYGTGSKPGKFKVPDLRGRFVRGVDHGAGRDPDAASRTASAPGGNTGDKVGSVQEDQFKSHTHNFRVGGGNEGHYNTVGGGDDDNIQGAKMLPRGGSETRPKNIYVNWIIKAK